MTINKASSSTTARLLPAAAAALVFSASMFLGMYLLISGKHGVLNKAETLPTIDFVRLKRESELQTIERRKPPPPPPPKTPPPPPKLKVAADTPQQQTPLPFPMPNLGLSASVGGGPFLGQMGSGAPTAGLFDGDIIPLQRIAPQCPRQAARDGLIGELKLEVLVNADGSVRSARVTEAKPRGVFDAAAVSSVLKWKFKPRVVDGKAVEQRGIQPMTFNCSGE